MHYQWFPQKPFLLYKVDLDKVCLDFEPLDSCLVPLASSGYLRHCLNQNQNRKQKPLHQHCSAIKCHNSRALEGTLVQFLFVSKKLFKLLQVMGSATGPPHPVDSGMWRRTKRIGEAKTPSGAPFALGKVSPVSSVRTRQRRGSGAKRPRLASTGADSNVKWQSGWPTMVMMMLMMVMMMVTMMQVTE